MTRRWWGLRTLVAVPVLVEAGLCAAAALAGGLVYGEFFATAGYLPVLGLASVAGTAVAVVAAGRRRGLVGTLLAVVGGFALLASYGVFGDTVEYGLPTGRTASAIVRGVVGGWARMLTVGLPADVRGDLLVTPTLLTWMAAFAAMTLALRTRSILAPVTPTLAAFVAALLFAGKQHDVAVTATASLLAAILLQILVRANKVGTAKPMQVGAQKFDGASTVGQRPQKTSLLAGGSVIVVSALLGIVGGQVLPLASGEQRFDPRDLRPPPVQIADTLTPLAKLKSELREQPPRDLFTVHISQPSPPFVDRIRTAALDQFDGVVWTSADRYVVAGSRLAADRGLTKVQHVAAQIEVKDLPGPFLPVLGQPAQLEVASGDAGVVGFSATSGVLVSTAPTLRGLSYDISGDVSSHDDDLPRALPSTSPRFRGDTALPEDFPASLRALAVRLTQSASTPYDKLRALENHLRAGPYSLDAPAGHSIAAINRLLTGTGRDNPGFAEQYAAAFTVLARALGFPARVAVGYRLHDYHDGGYTVTTRDAHAWPEVHFDGYGWVSFEPTPTSSTVTDPPRQPEVPPVVGPRQPKPPPLAPPAAVLVPDTPSRSVFGWTGLLRGMALKAASLASSVALAAALIVTEKSRRRRRRHRADSHAARVLGAWREMTDRLTERGVTFPVSLTAQETAEHAQSVLGSTAGSVTAAAPLATAAVFAPGEVHEQDATRAWHLEAQLRTDLYPRRLFARRLLARVDPRPLLAGWREARQRGKALHRLRVGRSR